MKPAVLLLAILAAVWLLTRRPPEASARLEPRERPQEPADPADDIGGPDWVLTQYMDRLQAAHDRARAWQSGSLSGGS